VCGVVWLGLTGAVKGSLQMSSLVGSRAATRGSIAGPCTEEVSGSIPLRSTIHLQGNRPC